MTKEELIALSDLNREDNIKYISSEAQGIAITLDCDRYAPTFCKLERAYICGRRKSEEQIEQLEKENAELKHTIATLRQEKDNVSMHAKAMEVVAKTRSDQLTKAKEIIKTFLGFADAFGYSPSMDKFISDTEQFLNSEVEKKWKR